MSAVPRPLPRPLSDGAVRLCALACAAGFGGFLVWSAAAPLAEGVNASGQIVVQDDRKTVQHFEGGIIRELMVSEGDRVEAGQTLLILEPLQSEAQRDEIAQELAVQTASIERLSALRAGREAPGFAGLDAIEIDPSVRDAIRARQAALFAEQAAARDAEVEVLTTRRATLEGRASDLEGQIRATEAALRSGREDLALRRQLLAERLETVGTVSALEREVSRLDADLSRLRGSRNEAISGIQETTDQIRQAEAAFAERAGREILEAQARALGARERLRSTQDRLARTVITAPIGGEVLNLAFATVGGVVRQGDPIMEIVPDSGSLVASLRLQPTDRDAVVPGQTVEAQLTAYKGFVASARMEGKVVGVSADLLTDPATGVPYYEARVRLDAEGLDPADGIVIIPGMPVDAFIASGRSRTMMSYMLEPVTTTFRRGSQMN